ncbi:hypothetical protein PR048_024926 [Dryococelus australis]|uniref:Reverse transcriptase/retrotransposon-derived protein RNase H-like domain-containing protein n=1 Tax=Dryococelus australis TaxID=614101 RepID=A0ABQ9GPX2_9NEOP|nr:hypothetical protein PR048_024926 [Dryococelus australis]
MASGRDLILREHQTPRQKDVRLDFERRFRAPRFYHLNTLQQTTHPCLKIGLRLQQPLLIDSKDSREDIQKFPFAHIRRRRFSIGCCIEVKSLLFLTELLVIGLHNCEVYIHLHRVIQGVPNKVRYNDNLIAKNALKRKYVAFVWGTEQRNAFCQKKEKLTTPSVLHLPQFNKSFTLQVDASYKALGTALCQIEDENLVPVAYASQLLTPSEQRYPTYEKEALEAIFGMEKFSDYEASELMLHTDNQALSWFLSTNKPACRLARWLMTQTKFNDNEVADCLSRMFDEEKFCEVTPSDSSECITIEGVEFCEDFPQAYSTLQQYQETGPESISIRLAHSDPAYTMVYITSGIAAGKAGHYDVRKGLIGYNNLKTKCFNLYVLKALRCQMFHYYQNTFFGGHSG